MSTSQILELEKIDHFREQFMKVAENKCCKRRVGAYEYSSDLQQPLDQAEYWQLTIKKRLGHQVSSRKLVCTRKKSRVTEATITLTLRQMIHKKYLAIAEFKELRKDQIEHPKSYVRKIAVAIAARKGTDPEKEEKCLLRVEDQ